MSEQDDSSAGSSPPARQTQADPVDARSGIASGRLAALIDARRELLESLDSHPEWAPMEAELSDFLKAFLDGSSLRLLRIDSNTPAAMLDQIVRYEAVHRIRDSRDLQRRLAADRRCYAFVHPALPDEPLIFTEVALTDGMSSNAQALLDPDSPPGDPSRCDCATFYSISSCHEGLRGVPLGNALIRRVADELARILPSIRTFATLSPVPGFRSWLTDLARSDAADAASVSASAALANLEEVDWCSNVERSAEAEQRLVPLCAYYLLRVKRSDQPADPVARFHLRNGARLERINWLSDVSAAGMRRAAGLMVNYVYRCNDPRRRYDAFLTTHLINAAPEVKRLAAQASSLFLH